MKDADFWVGDARRDYLNACIRNIPDFPTPGILFKDITPLLGDPRALHIVIDGLAEGLMGCGIDAVIGIESRGFLFGPSLALRLNAGFVPVRKPGKLPADVDSIAYCLEYGSNELQMHKDALRAGARVVIVDDLLATGGTAEATARLARNQGAEVVAYAFVVELSFLEGRKKLGDTPVISLLRYGEGE
jgi:adenine phosphoribosyltransferase